MTGRAGREAHGGRTSTADAGGTAVAGASRARAEATFPDAVPTLAAMEPVVELALRAGAAILDVYGRADGDVGLEWKDDRSPLTAADRAAHEVIVAGLEAMAPGLPIVSEEGDLPSNADALGDGPFWLVDPLDGTKEFLKRSGEFTVNIALVRDGRPVAGVVHAPVLGLSWVAGCDGAELREGGVVTRDGAERGEGQLRESAASGDGAAVRDAAAGKGTRLRVRPAAASGRLGIVASRDHVGPQVRALLERLPGAETLSMGSSLKFCLIAEGRADLYLRDGPTMEWDTAAAHAVVAAAGGEVFTLDGEPLRYGKPDLRNPPFVAVGDLELGWREIVGG